MIGILAIGTPEKIIDALVERNVKNLNLICDDTGFLTRCGNGYNIKNDYICWTNPETARQ